ncbi:hypothetical protein LZ009_08015 [Ramlibacter sp. XY19]|uniref:hypothetical protein n=1 Tax=Ramlibacter paludis TaxID=2908000 RepID=UPI0023DC185A|nr:hypothetical protein [Ramlibacter paludis]MCG2592726.1 hypothetical protein [Ramlibacter paludis]
MNWLRSFVNRSPRQALVAGKILFLAGSILVLAAVFARAGAANAVPAFLAWLVPQGPAGFIVAALLVLAGMTLILLAEKAGKGRR